MTKQCVTHHACDCILAEREKLRAETAKLRDALLVAKTTIRFYAQGAAVIGLDEGTVAREALARIAAIVGG